MLSMTNYCEEMPAGGDLLPVQGGTVETAVIYKAFKGFSTRGGFLQ